MVDARDHHELSVRRSYFEWARDLLSWRDWRGGTLIELGTGTGLVARELHDVLGLSSTLLLDFSPKAVEIAAANVQGRNIRVCAADVLEFDTDERFDIALSIGLVEHFEGAALERVIARHATLLKPNGCAVVMQPKKGLLWPLLFIFNRAQRIRENPPSDRTLARLCAANGLQVVKKRALLAGFVTGLAARKPA
jgi:SAM-dependent methyltransferase